ncbi:hypothetical protein HID58_047335 [Brassica napus]|uniref:Uncharacterized protein n=1 Tax=Brassica napus TaxID=3708 RepID=A0ABQ8AZ11_BRANA|nr:hypothetical protein HID58_047335 [Brassica napus]
MAHMKALFHYVKMDQFMMFSGSSSGFRVCSCIWLYPFSISCNNLSLCPACVTIFDKKCKTSKLTMGMLKLFAKILSLSLLHLKLIKIFNYDRKPYFKKMFERLYQAEWKPEFPDRFSEISELVKAVDSLKLEDGKSQGLSLLDKDQLRRKLLLPSPLYKNRLNIGLRSPHAKHAAAIQAKLLGGNPAGEMSKNALKNKKKKGAEAAASGANNA